MRLFLDNAAAGRGERVLLLQEQPVLCGGFFAPPRLDQRKASAQLVAGELEDVERDLAEKLIDQLSSDGFEPEKYHDAYAKRVHTAVDQKVAGEEITIAPEQPKAQIIGLFESLEKSLAEGTEAPKPPRKAAAKAEQKAKPKPPKKAAARRNSSKKTKTG